MVPVSLRARANRILAGTRRSGRRVRRFPQVPNGCDRQLASFNSWAENISPYRKGRVLDLKGRPTDGDAEGLLRVLERSRHLIPHIEPCGAMSS